jgi:hypothetical protein
VKIATFFIIVSLIFRFHMHSAVFALGMGKTRQHSFSVAKYSKKFLVAVCPSVICHAALDNNTKWRRNSCRPIARSNPPFSTDGAVVARGVAKVRCFINISKCMTAAGPAAKRYIITAPMTARPISRS